MRPRTAARLAWSLWSVSVATLSAAVLLAATTEIPSFSEDVVGLAALVVAFAAFPTVGALVASRRPGNAAGWLFVAIGALTGVGTLGAAYAEFALGIQGDRTALGVGAAWIASWYWYPLLGLTTIFTLLLFPDGRLPSRRWRPVAYLTGLTIAGLTLHAALAQTIEGEGFSIGNPVGISGLDYVEETTVGDLMFALFLPALVGAVLSLIMRFRRSRGDERQQLKWFVYAGAIVVLFITVDELFGGLFGQSNLFFAVAISLLPIAMGTAILKYRLYDIDLIINRTLVYGALTAVLAGVYVAGVVGIGGILRELTQQENNSLAVAASTLAVAALFRPARARIQGFIDRRFYRRKYDAVKTLESFSTRLRDEIDLDELSADLLGAIKETMQPAHASLWLRPGAGR